MKNGAIFSIILHLSVLLLIFFGIPHLNNPNTELIQPIPVEIVTMDDPEVSKAKVKTVKKAEPKKEEPKKTEPELADPIPSKLSQPEEKPQLAKLDEPEVQLPELIPTPTKPKIAPKLTPQPRAKPKKIATRRKEQVAQPKKKKPQEPDDELTSLLKNLQKNEPSTPEPAHTALESTQLGNINNVLSMIELGALRRQIAQCWNIPAGARDAQNLTVEIHVSVNPNGTVRHARIVDTGRINSDSYYRAAAESALRAVLNPKCSPLKLPPQKYEQWKEFTLRFDPKDML